MASKRIFDVLLAVLTAVLLALPGVIVCIAIKITSKGPVLYNSERIGRYNKSFMMHKFRTMKVSTPQLATHLLETPGAYLTPIGDFLRKTSIDEIPQLYNIIKGDMSFVGPRPALFNQTDLVSLRTDMGIHTLMPGLTGWAQINGRDDLPMASKVAFDRYYLENNSFIFDLRILLITLFKVIKKEGVSH